MVSKLKLLPLRFLRQTLKSARSCFLGRFQNTGKRNLRHIKTSAERCHCHGRSGRPPGQVGSAAGLALQSLEDAVQVIAHRNPCCVAKFWGPDKYSNTPGITLSRNLSLSILSVSSRRCKDCWLERTPLSRQPGRGKVRRRGFLV